MFCLPELRTLRLEHFFDAIILSSDYGFRKPDPRLFRIAMSILDVSPKDTAYIGNKYETDTVGAKNADLALTGLINQNDNQQFPTEKKPDFVVKNLKQAYEVIIAQSTRVSM